jgi:hypothetical protein
MTAALPGASLLGYLGCRVVDSDVQYLRNVAVGVVGCRSIAGVLYWVYIPLLASYSRYSVLQL